MSLLSTFLKKPYTGLSQSNQNQLLFAPPAGRPILRLESTDLTAGAEIYPQIGLWTDRNVVGAGGAIQWQAQNAAPTFLPIATLAASINTLTPTAESSQIDLSVYASGAIKKMSLRGDLSALVPAIAGALALGTSSLLWASASIGDGTRNGSMLPDVASSTILIGSDSNHGLSFKTNAGIKARFDASGRFSHNDVISAGVMHHLGGTHVGNAATLYGYDVTLTLPATTTTLASMYYSTPATVASSFTLTDLASFHAGDVTRGAGSVVSNYYHFRAQGAGSGTNNVYGFHSNLPLNSTTTYAFYGAGTAPSLFNGPVGVNVSAGSPFSGYLYADNVGSSIASAYLVTRATLTGLQIDMRGGTYTAAETFVLLSQTGTGVFKIQGNGCMLHGAAAVTAGQPAGFNASFSGGINVIAYDTYTSSVAQSLTITGSHAVGALASAYDLNINCTVTSMSATGVYYGLNVSPTVTASTAGAIAYAMVGQLTMGGAGAGTGMVFNAFASTGATGTLTGLQIGVAPAATSGTATGLALQLTSVLAPTTYGVRIFGNGGVQVANAVYIDSTLSITAWAFQYNQRASATGGFLSFVDSGAATRFSVDVNGDMLLGSTSRRIKGDLSNATHANRLIFVNSSGALSSYVGAAPSAAGLGAGFVCYGNPDPSNSAYLQINHDGASAATLFSTAVGTGTTQPLRLQLAGQVVCLSAELNGDIRLGAISGMVTTSTFGFPYIPSVAGAPTGVPTVRAGFVPAVFDSTNSKIWFYSGSWKGVVVA